MKLRYTWTACLAAAVLVVNLFLPLAQAGAAGPEIKPVLPTADKLQPVVTWDRPLRR